MPSINSKFVVAQNKAIIRQEMLALRSKLPEDAVRLASLFICERLAIRLNFLRNSNYALKNLAIFYPLKKEVNIFYLLDKIDSSWNFFLPCTDNTQAESLKEGSKNNNPKKVDNDMVFRPYKKGDILYPSKTTKIPEPLAKLPIADDIDIIIAPLLAFDKQNNRLGYGKGYYDRYFHKTNHSNIYRIGVAYKFMQVDIIPTSRFDVKMDEIITD